LVAPALLLRQQGSRQMARSIGFRVQWQPSDYILRGQLCPRSEIESSLASIASRTGAADALLLVADRLAFLKTLTVGHGLSGQPIADAMRGAPLAENETKRLAGLLQWDVPRGTSRRRVGQILSVFRRVLDFSSAYELDPEDWVQIGPSRSIYEARLQQRVLLRGAVSTAGTSSIVELLYQQVACTTQASIRSDTSTMMVVDRALDYGTVTAGRTPEADMYSRLAALARTVTNSSSVTLYMRRPGSSEIRKLSEDADSIALLPETIQDTDNNVIAQCLRLHKPLQEPPGLPVVETQSNNWHTAPYSMVCLATPVPGPFASPRFMAVGALVALRPEWPGPSKGSGFYDAYELALLRNVALRVALIRSHSSTERLFIVAHGVRQGIRESLADNWNLDGKVLVSRQPSSRGDRPGVLPYDIELAIREIGRLLEEAAGATTAHSATFRLLSPMPDEVGPGRQTLVRVAAYPESRLHDPKSCLYSDAGGMVWRVARSGNPLYYPKLASEETGSFVTVREGTRSAMAAPVFVGGRLQGVVNVESRIEKGLDGYWALISSIAQAIGESIAQARSELSQSLLSRAIDVLDTGHSIASEDCRELARQIGEFAEMDVPVTEALERVDAISQKVRLMRSRIPPPPAPLPNTVGGVIRVAISQRKVKDFGLSGQLRVARMELDPAVARAALRTLQAVLHNIAIHSETRIAGMTIGLQQGEIGGLVFAYISLSSVSKYERAGAKDAYRVPLASNGLPLAYDPDNARPRIGAFTAGEILRANRGEVYMVSMGGGRMETVLSLPTKLQYSDAP
jgi:GAF domain-containing protein